MFQKRIVHRDHFLFCVYVCYSHIMNLDLFVFFLFIFLRSIFHHIVRFSPITKESVAS